MIIMISSSMNCHTVGAVFLLTNSERAADPAQDAPSNPAHNSTHEAADRAKYLIPSIGTSTRAITDARRDTLSLRSGCYGDERDCTGEKFETRIHV
jgi:hypothetical protein